MTATVRSQRWIDLCRKNHGYMLSGHRGRTHLTHQQKVRNIKFISQDYNDDDDDDDVDDDDHDEDD